MQPYRALSKLLEAVASEDHYLFSPDDLRCAFPDTTSAALNGLLHRAERSGQLQRVCRGIYLFPKVPYPGGLVLFHTAAKLRAGEFNYLSLETVLSDAGVISQIPTNWITLMSSGRKHVVNCGRFGHIEFVHTKRRPDTVADSLTYDGTCHLWRASVPLALQDMRITRRSLDLVAQEEADEFV